MTGGAGGATMEYGDSVIQESGTGILVSAGQQIYQAENVQLEEEIFNTLSVPRSTVSGAIVRRTRYG